MKIPKRFLREPMLFLDPKVDNNLVLCEESLIQWSSRSCRVAAGIERAALPLARLFFLPTAKRNGEELLKQSVPEVLDVNGNKKSPK